MNRSPAPSIAVVGTGHWGSNHVRTWSELGLLATICDPNEASLQRAKLLAPEATASSFADVLADRTLDAVVLATPAATHEDMAVAVVESGKDVLVEKPLALTRAGGERVQEAAARHGRIVAVGHLLEYHPAFLEIRRMLATGTLGRLQYIYSNRLNLGRVRTEENALWSFAPHDVALILRLLGEDPISVACHGAAYLSTGVADVTTTHLSFANGVHAHIYVSWLHPFKEHRFVVIGSEGMAVFDDTRDWEDKLVVYPHLVHWDNGQAPVARRADGRPVTLERHEPLRSQCEDFARSVRDRVPPLVDASTGVRVLAVLERATASLNHSGVKEANIDSTVKIHPTATIDSDVTIGKGTAVWHNAHVSSGAFVGRDCSLGQNTYVGPGVRMGDGVRLQNNVSVYEGVELADGVFCGPSMVFTNVRNPRAGVARKSDFSPTVVGRGATLGANCTIVCGTTVGPFAMVGAGAVVTSDVAAHELVVGVPARRLGWVCECGERLHGAGEVTCARCALGYRVDDDAITPRRPASPQGS